MPATRLVETLERLGWFEREAMLAFRANVATAAE
jgi:hypothetical protein